MSIAVELDSVWKRYLLGEPNRSLAGALASLVGRGAARKELWALRDINLSIERGQMFGIVGRNGAGKSTLLKILSRITRPERGSLKINGRVAALLEIGAGFHPDLTGRENIFLYGTLFGLRKREVAKRLDEIIDFSGLSEFIDTPVKRYSSGMYMRLGFSVAVNFDPDVLLVDEVLAVGDMAFQNKCLKHMMSLPAKGTTVLFVSHNLAAVEQLCDHAVLICKGQVDMIGDCQSVTARYRSLPDETPGAQHGGGRGNISDSAPIVIEDVNWVNESGITPPSFNGKDGMSAIIAYNARIPVRDPVFKVSFFAHDGTYCTEFKTCLDGVRTGILEGAGRITLKCPHLNLLSGTYFASVGVCDSTGLIDYDRRERAWVLPVESDRMEIGIVRIDHEWDISQTCACVK